jgi:hypothetical protein
MELARADNSTNNLPVYCEIFQRTESPAVLGSIVFKCLGETARGQQGYDFALLGAQSFQVPGDWQVPNEVFWRRFVPKTTFYRIAPVQGNFKIHKTPDDGRQTIRVAMNDTNGLGSAYFQFGWWLPERRSGVLAEMKRQGVPEPQLKPDAVLCYSVTARFSSSNECGRLTVRDLLSPVGLNSVMARGTNWMEYNIARVVDDEARPGLLSGHVLPKTPLERLPSGLKELAEIKRFFPDEHKYAPVMEWFPSSTNAWMELKDARLIILPPRNCCNQAQK